MMNCPNLKWRFAFPLLVAFCACTLHAQTFSLPIADEAAFFSEAKYMSSNYYLDWSYVLRANKHAIVRPEAGIQIGGGYKDIRFDNHMVFRDVNGSLLMFPDSIASNYYPDKPFKHGYSRLGAGYFRVSADLGLNFVSRDEEINFKISTGPILDLRTSSKYKRKWFADGEDKMKEKIKGNELLQLANYNAGWRVSARLGILQVSYEYYFMNHFKDSWGIDKRFNKFTFDIVIPLNDNEDDE